MRGDLIRLDIHGLVDIAPLINGTINEKVPEDCPWKLHPKNMGNQLHTICSYMAMFPPSLPSYFIKKYSKENDVVFDPFSGRGTTVLEACLMNRIGLGNDINPLASLLSKAKANVPHKIGERI